MVKLTSKLLAVLLLITLSLPPAEAFTLRGLGKGLGDIVLFIPRCIRDSVYEVARIIYLQRLYE